MRKILTLSTAIMALCISTAYAGEQHGFLSNFAQGAGQTLQQQQGEQNAGKAANDTVDALLAQYKLCLESNPFSKKIDAFLSVLNQNGQCIDTNQQAVLHAASGTPLFVKEIAWFINGKPDDTPAAHKATDTESGLLGVLLKSRKQCVDTVLNYSGPQDTYVTGVMRAFKKMEAAYDSQIENYINGKTTRGEFLKSKARIASVYKADFTRVYNDYAAAQDANFEDRRQLCSAQLEANKQQVLEQVDHREVIRTNQRANAAEANAANAEMDKSNAEFDADSANRRAAEAERRATEAEIDSNRR